MAESVDIKSAIKTLFQATAGVAATSVNMEYLTYIDGVLRRMPVMTTNIARDFDANNFIQRGRFMSVGQNGANWPVADANGGVAYNVGHSSEYLTQMYWKCTDEQPQIYVRTYKCGEWRPWYKFALEKV